MALHDYQCVACRRLLVDVNVPAVIGAQRGAPICGVCGQPMAWVPKIGRMDAREPFQRFTCYDGRNRLVEVDSLHKLRQVEAESERMARNGDGQQMVFRRWAQDDSNKDQGVLGKWDGPAEKPDMDWVKSKGGFASPDAQQAQDTSYGPGVSDENASALGHLTK